MTDRFRVRTPQVINETIDGEVVVINLETGSYYSVRESGAQIWSGIERAASVSDIVAWFGDDVQRDPGFEAEVRRFVAELQQEGLVTEADETHATASQPPPFTAGTGAPGRPTLEKFTEMQELILLDPVHEVDEGVGWPQRKPGA